MNHAIKLMIVLALSVCLPLETLAVVTMPFCSGSGSATHSAAMKSDAIVVDMSMDNCEHNSVKQSNCPTEHKSTCDKSGHCSLCAAQAFLSQEVPSIFSIAADVFSSQVEVDRHQSVTTSIFKPPITTLA